jgi:ketosteroid isomerase-like protein
MSRQNVELVRRAFDRWRSGDIDRAISGLDGSVEWHMASDEPDARTLRSREEVAEMLRGWVESFEEFSVSPLDFIDVGAEVVVPLRFVARPHGAAAPVTIEETQVFTIRDGWVVRVREYRTKTEALQAVGLSE